MPPYIHYSDDMYIRDTGPEERRESESPAFVPLPGCYYRKCVRGTSILTAMGRAALAGWCIHVQLISMRVGNYYADQKFALFWGDALVLLTVPFGLAAGFCVRRPILQIHCLLTCIAVVGPVLQIVFGAISYQLDGTGVNLNPKRVYSYKTGSYQTVYRGNDADPNIARLIVVIASLQLFVLMIAVGIHAWSLRKIKDYGITFGDRGRRRSSDPSGISLEPSVPYVPGCDYGDSDEDDECEASPKPSASGGDARVRTPSLMESPDVHEYDDGPKMDDPPPAYDKVVASETSAPSEAVCVAVSVAASDGIPEHIAESVPEEGEEASTAAPAAADTRPDTDDDQPDSRRTHSPGQEEAALLRPEETQV